MLICSVLFVALAFERIEGLWAVFRSETSFGYVCGKFVSNTIALQLNKVLPFSGAFSGVEKRW